MLVMMMMILFFSKKNKNKFIHFIIPFGTCIRKSSATQSYKCTLGLFMFP